MTAPPPRAVSLDDVVQFARQLDPAFLTCRTRQHTWDDLATTVAVRDGEYHETTECSRCDTMRTQIVDADTGEIKGNRYEYPDGYALEGIGRWTSRSRGVLRLQRMRNFKGRKPR